MTTLTTKHQRLAALRPLYPESVASLTAASDVRRVYESNSIEGKSLTLRETELVLSKALARPGSSLTKRDLLDLHQILLTRIQDGTNGIYRTYAVRVGGSNQVPPNAAKVPDLMTGLSNNLRQAYCNALETADSSDFPTWENFMATQLHHELDTWLKHINFLSLITDH